MRLTKFALAVLTLLIGGRPAIAQTHLVPEFSPYSSETEADTKLPRAIFPEAFLNNVLVRMLAESYIGPTSVVGLKHDGDVVSIFAAATKAQIRTYYQGPPFNVACITKHDACPDASTPEKLLAMYPHIQIDRCEAAIPSSLALRIAAAWKEIVFETHYARGDEYVTWPNGTKQDVTVFSTVQTQYHFSTEDMGGQLWNVSSLTKPGKLVSIASKMSDYCMSKNPLLLKRLDEQVSELSNVIQRESK